MTRASHLLCLFHDFTKLRHCQSGNFLFYLVFTLNVFLQQFLAALSHGSVAVFFGRQGFFTRTLWPAKIPELFILFLEFLDGSNGVFAFSIKINFMIWPRNKTKTWGLSLQQFWSQSMVVDVGNFSQCFYYPNEVVWDPPPVWWLLMPPLLGFATSWLNPLQGVST